MSYTFNRKPLCLTLNFYADPGHAWLKVPRRYLESFNIADKISSYSYQRNDHVYLEEDCDASILIETLKTHNVQVKIIECHTNRRSKIRSYKPYSEQKYAYMGVK